MGGYWCPSAQPSPASDALLVGLRDDDESGDVGALRPPFEVTQEAVTGAPTHPDRSPSSTRAPKSFGRRDVNRCAKVLGVSVDFEATDWLALAHGPIVDIMITYGVLRGVVRLLDRRGRGTSPHLIVRRQIRGIRKR